MSLPCPTLLCYPGIMAPPFSKCGDDEVKRCITGSWSRARHCLVAEAVVAAIVADFRSQWVVQVHCIKGFSWFLSFELHSCTTDSVHHLLLLSTWPVAYASDWLQFWILFKVQLQRIDGGLWVSYIQFPPLLPLSFVPWRRSLWQTQFPCLWNRIHSLRKSHSSKVCLGENYYCCLFVCF